MSVYSGAAGSVGGRKKNCFLMPSQPWRLCICGGDGGGEGVKSVCVCVCERERERERGYRDTRDILKNMKCHKARSKHSVFLS